MKRVFFFVVACVFFIVSCSTQKNLEGKPITSLTFIDEFSLPHKMDFNGTTVGGLSGIDYVAKDKVYHLICDDRSDINPLRYYTLKIKLSKRGIDTVQFVKVTSFLQRNGQHYPSRKQNFFGTPDPEAIRYNTKDKMIVWSSEGERTVRNNQTVLTNPSINVSGKDGKFIDTFALPLNMHMKASEKGPRNNGVFEGLTFTPDFKKLYVSVEEPIYEDGPRAGLFDSSGWIRIICYDVATRMPLAQYAYQIDPVAQEPISTGLFTVNGVSEILAINDWQLLVVERSFSTGRLSNNIRVYLVDLREAEDVKDIVSLKKYPSQKVLQKKLLLNMDRLGRLIDNIEGVTFGPVLPNGKRSLIFVSDDNFSPNQKTQFLLFEVD
jgi:hypothetical protein